jgi:alpha-amylase
VTWGPKNASAGSPFFTHSWTFEQNPFTGKRPALEYPAVPYGPEDFHCERPMNDWASGFSLNYGWLAGLADLNTERPFVQQRIADYLTELIGLGYVDIQG